MRLYLDDIRQCPAGWDLARTFREAQLKVQMQARAGVQYETMSLDHDLGILYCHACAFSDADEPCLDAEYKPQCGCDCHEVSPTGMDFLRWIDTNKLWPKNKPTVHSANPIGALNMQRFIDEIGPYEKK